MNKLSKYFNIFIILGAIVIALGWLGKSLLNLGQFYINRNDYVKAERVLSWGMFLNKNNSDYRYYYVKALVKLPPNLEVQKKVFDIASGGIEDSAQSFAYTQVKQWRSNIIQNIGTNYIEQAPFESGVLRWNSEDFPIRVCILNDSKRELPEYYETEIRKALIQWHNSTSIIDFKVVDNPNGANIIIKISELPKNICNGQVCQYTVGYTTPSYRGKHLRKMTIILYATNPAGYYFSNTELYNTVLHELGHALGIMGHSYNSDDLMHMSTEGDNKYTKYRSSFQYISSNDINTVKLLYRLMPDITNSKITKTKGLIYAPILLGTSSEVLERKLKEAKNYIKNAPNLPAGYIDLGIAYIELNKPKNAVKAFKKALTFVKSDADRYIINYNLANVYFKMKDYNNAKYYAQAAKEVSNTEEVNILLSEINSRR